MPVRVVETSAHGPSQFPGSISGHTSLPACTLLSVGQAFSGTQNVSSLQKEEAWRVNVRLQGCDLDHGYLCGTMEALNVPMADTLYKASESVLQTINPQIGELMMHHCSYDTSDKDRAQEIKTYKLKSENLQALKDATCKSSEEVLVGEICRYHGGKLSFSRS
ncbi:hypothetical protein ACFE04_020420 [Oxalis oulophora]